jgi:hypothetical protein
MGGEGLFHTVIERSKPPGLGGVAQLGFFDISRYWYIENLQKILSPAGVKTLVDSCCLSVSTIAS